MTVFFTIFFIMLTLVVGMFIYLSGGSFSSAGAEFITRGKEAGLSSKEIKVLKKTADVLGMDKPLLLLGSVKNIDNAIDRLNSMLKESDFRDIDTLDLVEELYQYRKKIELQRMERRSSITSTRQIDADQQVKITVGSIEKPIIGILKENNQEFLAINLLTETSVKPGMNWNGPINVYFWKKNDAGYFFESVVGESTAKQWKIAHSDSLIRSQKRGDIRVDLEQNAYVYKLDNIGKKNSRHEGFTGTFAQLKNISEGGLAFLINGNVDPDSALKIEFKLNEQVVVVCGTIKESSYNKSNNISLIRMKIVDPGFEMLSIIRSYLYTSNRDLFKVKENKNVKDVENKEEINNNNQVEEDVTEVEYIPENSGVIN